MKRAITVLLPAFLLLSACSRKEKSAVEAASTKPADPVSVRTVPAEARTIDRTVSVTGSLNPDETVTVSSEVAGRVSRILVDFGQPVRKGQVLVELDRRELQLQLDRAKANLAQAQARLGLDPTNPGTVENTAAMRQASAQMEDARTKYENARKLVATGDISQERFIELEKSFRARQAMFDQMKDEMRTQTVGLDGLRTDIALAEKRLNDATVRAPFDGAVTQKHVSPGQYTAANTALLTVVKTNPMRLRVDIPETASAAVRVGSTLKFRTDAVAGKIFSAVVSELNPSLDARSRSLTAEARLPQSDPHLRPGMFVQVDLVLAANAQVVAVPKRALYTVAGLTKMFVIRNGKAVELKVTPGQDLGDFVELPSGTVQAGEPVAVSSLTQLINGSPVRATQAAAAGASGE
jgi:RND family efflux transporter MFP subunit